MAVNPDKLFYKSSSLSGDINEVFSPDNGGKATMQVKRHSDKSFTLSESFVDYLQSERAFALVYEPSKPFMFSYNQVNTFFKLIAFAGFLAALFYIGLTAR